MSRLILIAVLALVVWKMATGRWPWQAGTSARHEALGRARTLLGVKANARRTEIIEAHMRLIGMVHPDRGGTNEQVHEANAARDLLLGELPDESMEAR